MPSQLSSLLDRGWCLGNRNFDQGVRERRRASEIRKGPRVKRVHGGPHSAQAAPISERGDNDPLHNVTVHLRNRLEAAAIIKDPNGASFADVPCESIIWIDKHDLLPGVTQLRRQAAIA